MTASSEPPMLDLEALLQGNHAAFEQLVHQESGRLFRVIVRIVGNEDEAESVMQEAFLQAYKRLDTFRRESKVTTWLYAIAINLARASLRKTRRFDAMEEEEMERLQPTFSKGMYAAPPEQWNPQKVSEQKERMQLVRRAIERLPDDYQVVVTLRDLEERSTAEVARILDISEGAVRVRLHRARQALRQLLVQHFR